jgi:hypothetical protein
LAWIERKSEKSKPLRWRVLEYNMKFTKYFLFMRNRPDRAVIKEEWILKTVNNPMKQETQSDGRIWKWSYIEETGKYLRVIVLEDGETVHNAFFDRGFKEEEA